MEELKTPVRIQIVPPPIQSPHSELERTESLPWHYTLLLFLTLVFSAASLYLSFVA